MLKRFLMLVAMAKPDARLLQDAIARIKREADVNAAPAWIDANAAGIFMTTHLSAREVLTCILPGNPTHEQRQAVREVLVLEIGEEACSSSTSSKAAGMAELAPESASGIGLHGNTSASAIGSSGQKIERRWAEVARAYQAPVHATGPLVAMKSRPRKRRRVAARGRKR